MFFVINPKYNNKSMCILNEMGTIYNAFSTAHEKCTGRYKYLKMASNVSLNGIKLVAYGIKLLVVLFFEKLLAPYSKFKYQALKKAQVENDLKDYSQTGRNVAILKNEIKVFIQAEGLFADKDQKKIDTYVDRAAATYASSRLHYAPVVVDWVHSILETSLALNKPSEQPSRVVFLARDGIPAYEVAKKLIATNEEYAGIPVSLLYISRKVKDWAEKSDLNRAMLIEYATQEGIKKDQRCFFIDIGFLGSMIDPIKKIFKDITSDITFGYLVSHIQKAHGFMANMENKLGSVESAGGNRAVHWLEDTHQGVRNSAYELRKEQDGTIVPVVKDDSGEETCKKSSPKTYLYKYFGMKAILDTCGEIKKGTKYHKTSIARPQAWGMASEESKEKFDKFLSQYFVGKRKSFAVHF